MADINKRKDDVISVLFWLNVIFLAIGVFYATKTILILMVAFNLLLSGTFIILRKNLFLFTSILETNKFAKKLNNQLTRCG